MSETLQEEGWARLIDMGRKAHYYFNNQNKTACGNQLSDEDFYKIQSGEKPLLDANTILCKKFCKSCIKRLELYGGKIIE